MSAFARQSAPSGVGSGWQPDVMRLLDEHHLAAWSNHARLRLDFATSLGRFLAAQTDTEVCNFYGRYITNLDSFCHQLERLLTGPTLDRRIDGPRGVTSLLRAHEPVGPAPPSRFRFYIWDADGSFGVWTGMDYQADLFNEFATQVSVKVASLPARLIVS